MSIYTDVDARFNYQNWKCIFNKYLNEDNENISKSLEKSLLNFLFTYKYVPYEVWDFVEKKYKWSERKEELEKNFEGKNTKIIFQYLSGERLPIAHFIKNKSSDEIDRYFDIINECDEELFLKGSLEKAKLLIDEGYKIEKNDTNLIFTNGNYKSIAYNDYDSALEFFLKAYELDNNNISAILNIAIHYEIKRMYDEAIFYLKVNLEKINKSKFKNTIFNEYLQCARARSLFDLGESYYYKGDLNEAKITFQEVIKLNIGDYLVKDAKKFCFNIERILNKEKVKRIKPKRIRKKRKNPYKIAPDVKIRRITEKIAVGLVLLLGLIGIILIIFVIIKILKWILF